MATSTFTASSSRRNTAVETFAPTSGRRKRVAAPPIPTAYLDPDQYAGMLDLIESEGGFATLDDISRAFPAVESPVSAVFALLDAGVCADLNAAFGGEMLIWRNDTGMGSQVQSRGGRATPTPDAGPERLVDSDA